MALPSLEPWARARPISAHLRKGTGEFILRSISATAVDMHLAHGDGQVGGPVPGMAGMFFDEMCVPVTIFIPTGLSPGDMYRIAFVTSNARNAASTNIADYNLFVSNAANTIRELAALGTTWTAIGSTPAVVAYDNTSTRPSSVAGGSVGVPIFLLNDTMLAPSYDALWSTSDTVTLVNPLNINEFGNPANSGVFTGTREDGIGQEFLGLFAPTFGNSTLADRSWTAAGRTSEPALAFYGISGLLVVP